MSDSMLSLVCGGIVTAFDLVQQFGFSYLADNKLKKKQAELGGLNSNYLVELLKKRSKEDTEFNSDEQMLLKLFDKVQDFKERLPFDDTQTEGVKETLVIYLKEMDYQFSPTTLLFFTLISTLTPNVVEYKML